MEILVTNDDGIDSPGIWALAEAMSRVGEPFVVAPDKQQSGVGTALSFHDGMSVTEVSSRIPGIRAYAVGGTPSDCVLLAIRRHLAQGRIGLVVSGINLGANVGNDIIYSGTVMATLQGYFRKIPAIAVSLVTNDETGEPCFDVASRVAECLALGMTSGRIPTEAILNANVPNIPLKQIKGIVTTTTAPRGYVRLSAPQTSGSVKYAKGVDKAVELGIHEGTDIWAINTGFISITPLRLAVTADNLMPALAECTLALQSDLLGTGPESAQ